MSETSIQNGGEPQKAPERKAIGKSARDTPPPAPT